eukprot:2931358-Pyramimonas_sp.AAC.1
MFSQASVDRPGCRRGRNTYAYPTTKVGMLGPACICQAHMQSIGGLQWMTHRTTRAHQSARFNTLSVPS